MEFDLGAAWSRFENILRGAIALLPNMFIALIVFLLIWMLAGLLGRLGARLVLRAGQDPQLGVVFNRLTRWFVRLLGVMVAVTIVAPSLDTSSIFSAVGVGGVAVGFAFKDIFQNLLAGVLILVTKPFQIGDQIVAGAHEGTIEDIQIRATLMRTYDNRLVVIPNSELYTNRVVVNTGYDKRRIHLAVGVASIDDAHKARDVILQAIAGVERVLRDPAAVVLVRELGPYSVNLEVRYWINPTLRREVIESADEVLRAITPAMERAGVSLPYPTQTLHLKSEWSDEWPPQAQPAGAVQG